MADTSPLDRVLRDFANSKKYFDDLHQRFDKSYRAYRGILTARSEAAKWTSKAHPPYVFQIIETIVANMIDDRTLYRIRPRPWSGPAEEVAHRALAAKTLERLLRYENDVDRFQEKQRPFALQNHICGITAGKIYWKYAQGKVKSLETQHVAIRHPETDAVIGTRPTLVPVERTETIADHATFEVRDMRDLFWHEAASEIQKSPWVCDRVWMTMDELREMESRGIYKDVDKLGESRDFSPEGAQREEDLFKRSRTKDMIEVLEYWNRDMGRVITVGNRSVVLANRDWPFWHGEYPFIVSSSMPDLFQIPGVSDVEIVQELQEMLWTVMNQRLDNLALINNAIILLRSDVDDPDAFEFAPGAMWEVDDPQQVVMWTPNQVPAEISITAESQIKGDLQNITGGMPFMSGTDSTQVDNKTATGVSIFTNLAQRRLAAKKQNYAMAYARKAEQEIALYQQFMRSTRTIQIVGPDAAPDFIEVHPEGIKGRFNVEVEALSESLMRQEERAEGQALIQLAAQIAPLLQAVGQPLNMKMFVERWLRSYDIDDPDAYFTQMPQQPVPTQGGGGAAAQPEQQGPGGVTAPQSIAPEVSPSNQASMAPSVFTQRAGAATGGGRNV